MPRCSIDEAIAYPVLLVATACLGVGFGITVPALNTMTAAFNPGNADASVLVLNALLGVGTALAPVLVAVFVAIWQLPHDRPALAIVAFGAGPLQAAGIYLPDLFGLAAIVAAAMGALAFALTRSRVEVGAPVT